MSSSQESINQLINSLTPKTAHQYKVFHNKYITWAKKLNLVKDDLPLYTDLPINSQLIHWFILSNYLPDFSLITFKKIISSLKFLFKLCATFNEDYKFQLDNKYLDNLVQLYEINPSGSKQFSLVFNKISINLWNPETPRMNEKFFKNDIDKLKLLLDFQLHNYTNTSFVQRRSIVLGNWVKDETNEMLVYHENGLKIALIPQKNPFQCILFTISIYFYLRFYGVKKIYRGDGFPDLENDKNWCQLPVIRGKSVNKFPREETIGNYYHSIFRYSQLAYKKKDYFQTSSNEMSFPEFIEEDWKLLEGIQTRFPSQIGLDFVIGLNHGNIFESSLDSLPLMDSSLESKLFPEVNKYKNMVHHLSAKANNFIKMIELLRRVMLNNLPILFKWFPNHEIFKDDLFQNPEFITYLNANQTSLLKQYDLSIQNMINLLVEPLGHQSIISQPTNESNDFDLLEKLRQEAFHLVQSQTLSNFNILTQLLFRIFDKLETKKSTKEFIMTQLSSVNDTLKKQLTEQNDLDVYNISPPRKKRRSLINYNEQTNISENDTNNNESDDDTEELKTLVQQLVQKEISRSITSKIDDAILNMKDRLVDMIKHEVLKQIKDVKYNKNELISTVDDLKLNGTDVPMFQMREDINTIEDIILEWFTPNEQYDNECVHSMNQKYGKKWRVNNPFYKERKLVIEFYIHLVNDRRINRYEAVKLCEKLKGDNSISKFSQMLKQHKSINHTYHNLK